jgi:threonine dehydratase
VAIPDAELLAAARAMLLRAHLLVEPSGAAGLAAAMRDNLRGKSVVVIATGSNLRDDLLPAIAQASSHL